MRAPGGLFGADVPAGLRYQPDVLTASDEQGLLGNIGAVTFSTFELRGVVARRRVALFGRGGDEEAGWPPLPPWLIALRVRVGGWAGLDPEALQMALVNEYQPGAPIGWHRDAPAYGTVAGISLMSPCVMKFRPYRAPSQTGPRRAATHAIRLEPRSGYVLAGPSREHYEHHIPAGTELRYSITFRTLR